MLANSPKRLTLLVVPDGSSRVQRFVVSKRIIVGLVFSACFVFVAVAFMAVHYGHLVDQAMENASLKEENLALKGQVKEFQTSMRNALNVVTRIERFETKLRMMLQLSDPERNLAVGPVATPAGDKPREVPIFGELLPGIKESKAGQMLRLALLKSRVESIRTEAEVTEEHLRELKDFFDAQKTILASTPSIWPSRGWVTSDFGFRYDPYTGDRSMHRGLDIATQAGTTVVAPGDGQVISSEYNSYYGKVILIDHGNSVVTRYAHLSEISVREGDKVARGQKIGAVGNSGRSTGPHLHYEIEVNGIPVNPMKYILD
ncbi:MAG: M23 family metallopeptidase [Deltaproteobacteria bacterium]|nr:M23 family metallopeptidase [Deltaproteobacteria bacterium]